VFRAFTSVPIIANSVLLFFCSIEFVSSESAAVKFQPHRAFYEMSTTKIKRGSAIMDVDGRMVFEWRVICDGWVVEQRYIMRYHWEDGRTTNSNTLLSSWESKDGDHYKFFVRNTSAGESESFVEGEASYLREASKGVAKFHKPRKLDLELPRETIFPSHHTFALIDAAESGQKIVSMPVFDGSKLETASFVSSVIGSRSMLKGRFKQLKYREYWPVRMAFFSVDNKGIQPDYEITLHIHPNGIASGLILDYEQFSLRVDLLRLEMIEAPVC